MMISVLSVAAALLTGLLSASGPYDKQVREDGEVARVVNDAIGWQIRNMPAKGRSKSANPKYTGWADGVFLSAVAEWTSFDDSRGYRDWLKKVAEDVDYEPAARTVNPANDISVCMAYANLYNEDPQPRYLLDTFSDYGRQFEVLRGGWKMISPTIERLDYMIRYYPQMDDDLDFFISRNQERWCWCDALYMAAPTFAAFANITGKDEYREFMNREFWRTVGALYDPEERLIYRDTRYKTIKSDNGAKMFWGRGNGWTVGAIVRVLQNLPEDYPDRRKYENLLEEMMPRLVTLQDPDGYWNTSLLDREYYPNPETSATGFIAYALWWGINNGILKEKEYLPYAWKAWTALAKSVDPEGKLGRVQEIGDAPKNIGEDSNEVYGTAALILTGLEICKHLGHTQTPEKNVGRNLIQNRTSPEAVREALVLERAWVPYPAYSDRAGWDRMMGEFKDEIISLGEKYLDFEWQTVEATDYIEYETSGNREIMQTPLHANLNAVASLFAAELAEGKGRFIPKIANGAFLLCEMTSWAYSAHLAQLSYARRSLPVKGDNTLDLAECAVSHMLSWIHYYLKEEFDRIQPEISRRIRQEITYRVLDSYLERDDFWWMGFKGNSKLNNWTTACNSGVLISFMLLEDDPDRLAAAVWKSIRSIDLYINNLQGDGGIEEGPSYWGGAVGKLYDYLNALYMITGGKVSIFDEKMVRDMGEFIVRSYVGDGWCVNFADASARSRSEFSDWIYIFGKTIGSSLMTGFAAHRLKDQAFHPSPSLDVWRYLESLKNAGDFLSAEDDYVPARYSWYPETEFHYMSNDRGVFVAARGGYNDESHNHNDIGSFNLYHDNLPVIIDVGVATYTRQTFSEERYSIWTMQSNYHNVPVINGVAQAYGKQYRAADVRSTPTSFSADISGAYPEEASVRKWIRSYRMAGNVLTVTDNFALEEAKAPNQVNFMTWGKVDSSTPGVVSVSVEGRNMTLAYDRKAFSVEVEPIHLTDSNLTSVWEDTVYRVSLTARKLQKAGTYKFTLTKL